MELQKIKAKIVGFNAKGDSGKQEITLALSKKQKVIPVGRDVEVKVLSD